MSTGFAPEAMTSRASPAKPDNPEIAALLAGTTHLLLSIPPGPQGDAVLRHYREMIAGLSTLDWIGYLSTVGVYGDQAGALVDETATPLPNNERTKARAVAESGWLALGEEIGRPVQVFRLAGIYGPGRSAFDKLRAGTARRVVKPGQVFNRIHVEDIATVLEASIARPRAGAVYNVADDEPAPPEDVVAYRRRAVGGRAAAGGAVRGGRAHADGAELLFGHRRVMQRAHQIRARRDAAYPSYREGLSSLLVAIDTFSTSAATVASSRRRSCSRDWR